MNLVYSFRFVHFRRISGIFESAKQSSLRTVFFVLFFVFNFSLLFAYLLPCAFFPHSIDRNYLGSSEMKINFVLNGGALLTDIYIYF